MLFRSGYSLPITLMPANVSDGWYSGRITATHGNITESSRFTVYVSGSKTEIALWVILGALVVAGLVFIALYMYRHVSPRKRERIARAAPKKERVAKIERPAFSRQAEKKISMQPAINWGLAFWVCLALGLGLLFLHVFWGIVAVLGVIGIGSFAYGRLKQNSYALASGILFGLSAILLALSSVVSFLRVFLFQYGLYYWIGIGGLFCLLSLGQILPKARQFLLAEDLEVAKQREEEEKGQRKV